MTQIDSDSINPDSIRRELTERLVSLETLNPDLTQTELNRLRYLASHVGEDYFAEAAQQTARLVVLYLHSDVKQLGRGIMQDYFEQLHDSADMLRAAGEVAPALPAAVGTFSTALVPREQTGALDFCKIINRADIPKQLVKAADAFRRRNEVVATVFAIALDALWLISPTKTVAWLVNLFNEHQGNLDPDIARDALSTAFAQNIPMPTDFIEWVVRFASDQNLLEYWPRVTCLADKLLCQLALRAWFASHKPRSALLSQLRLHVRNGSADDDMLLAWVRRALDAIGLSVQRFMSLDRAEVEQKWKSASLASELHRIADLYAPTLLAANQILVLPDGAERLAMAFIGLAGASRTQWENATVVFAYRAVNRTFLLDMKLGRRPADTIRLLSFDDPVACKLALAELDLASQNFDSLAQRDKVAKLLSVYYASYRRPQLLGVEVAKRYRNLMRMMHDDFLTNQLEPELLKGVHDDNIIPEIVSIAAEARKYLGKRRADQNSLEDMLAAKISFERFVRQKRILIVRDILLAPHPE